jgi:hypothetical protein
VNPDDSLDSPLGAMRVGFVLGTSSNYTTQIPSGKPRNRARFRT